MNFDTFKRAVDSLDGYQGVRSMMGGEPTLHPEFERFARYLGSKFPERKNPLVYPQKDFINAIHRIELENYQFVDDGMKRIDIVGPGMFSNMGATYKKHYEIISDVLCFQGLNDHLNPIYHQSALITRKDLGISDDEWPAIRDACWMQNEWSASVTPKGAFFCEVAGVLDMLMDGPGGWLIEPGWWKRDPSEFGEQLNWCEICGFCLDTFSRDSSEEIDDVSPFWHEKLKELDSPKLRSGRVNVIKVQDGKISDESKKENKFFSAAMPYIEHYEDRFNAINSVLFTKDFEFVVIPDGQDFGMRLNALLQSGQEWFVLHSDNVKLTDDFKDLIGSYVLNPGTLHYINLSVSNDKMFVANADQENVGYAALFSKNAISLREFGYDRVAHTRSFSEIADMWHKDKIVELSSAIDTANWRPKLENGKRYAIWGTGSASSIAADAIKSCGSTLVLAVDRDVYKHGKDCYGVTIQAPNTLADQLDTFDYLIAANFTRFTEIKRDAMNLGVAESRILFMSDI